MARRSFFVSLLCILLGALPAYSAAVGMFDFRGLSADELKTVTGFLSRIEGQLPDKVKNHITRGLPDQNGRYTNPARKLVLRFSRLSSGINVPKCESVDNLEKAERIKDEFSRATREKGLVGLRYEGQVHSRVEVNKESAQGLQLVVDKAFLPVIAAGERGAATYNCGHRNTYRLAQAAVLNGIARVFDSLKYESVREAQAVGQNGICRNSSAYQSFGEIDCEDLKGSGALISERARYRNLTFGWDKSRKIFGKPYTESRMAFWPRAVSPYEYAGSVRDHFAFNFEFFMLDPEFQCRKPLLYRYFTQRFGQGNKTFVPRVAQAANCKVNTNLYVHWTDFKNDDEVEYFNDVVDLDPKRVVSVNYYRAAQGAAAMSMFGHAMFRIMTCNPVKRADGTEFCQPTREGDVIINPRANQRELRMDQLRGLFGGYPSQFLVSPFNDIYDEYGQADLRHLFNFPLGRTDAKGRFQPMTEQQKADFVYATLESYWTYVGNYKFVSNNCADEAMKLMQMATNDSSRIANANITTPHGMSKELARAGFIDNQLVESLKEAPLRAQLPVLKWLFFKAWDAKDRETHRQTVENNEYVDVSFLYDIYDAVEYIYERENGVKLKNIKAVEKEMKYWAEMAKIANSASRLCKNQDKYASEQARLAKLIAQADEVEQRYRKLYDAAKARWKNGDQKAFAEMREINRRFVQIISFLVDKRRKDLMDLVIDVAYEIAFPQNGKKTLCGRNGWGEVSSQQRAEIARYLTDYEQADELTQPYSKLNLKEEGGYGIPLDREVKRGSLEVEREFAREVERQFNSVISILNVVGPLIGNDHNLYERLLVLRETLLKESCDDGLADGPGGLGCR